jgi:ATP-dependent helicase/nuclease subunit A
MSIHQSKGLEFPLVIVPDLGKVFNRQDSQGLMIVDREAGICPGVVDLPRHARWDSLAVVVGRHRIRRQLLAEEMRVLYVALTRAEKKLILTASVKDPAESLRKWRARWKRHEGPLPNDEIHSARSMLDWLGPVAAVLEHEQSDALEIHEYTDAQVAAATDRAMQYSAKDEFDQRIARFEPLPKNPLPSQAAVEALGDASWRNPNEACTKLPAARAITQLTKAGRTTTAGESPSLRNIVNFSPPLPMPKFLEPTRAPTPTEAGTATHKVLQLLDFSTTADDESVRRQLRSFINARSITAHEASAVDLAAIVWFMNSELGRLLRDQAGSTHRELPVFAPAAADASVDPLDQTLLRGQLDVLVQTEAGLVVIDYKTDRITDQTLPERARFYRPQVLAYCHAMTRITGQPVVAAHLVFLALRRSVEVDVTAPESELADNAVGG